MPRSRSYDVLESLEKKGFVIMKIGKPIKYLAIPPEEVLERVKKRIRKEAEERVNVVESIKDSDVLNELVALHTQGVEKLDPSELAGALRGREAMYNHLESLIKEAKKSVVIITTPEGIERKIKALGRVLRKAKAKGVEISFITNEGVDEYLQKTIERFGKLKVKENIGSRMVFIDDEHLFFTLTSDEKVHPAHDVGVWVRTPDFVRSLQALISRA
ncbi:hypothetical protein D6783_00995 [Candidatus Woesearchaeota archaeon]|nr:MAG: hypothetical protein D6783_00995 [Candidatus Woesearchaeota archaeon]